MTSVSVKMLIERFRAAVSSGNNWYLALLETIREWPATKEEVNGNCYYYLIGDEAFDLAQISERLVEAVKDIIPASEQINLLFLGHPPIELAPEELKQRLGEEKYKQHLNFFYGITAEEALQEITSEEVRKEERGIRARTDDWVTDEAFQRIYGKTHSALVDCFRTDKGLATGDASLAEIKEFCYWLFKYRLANSDPEKSASDTKKALEWLRRQSRK